MSACDITHTLQAHRFQRRKQVQAASPHQYHQGMAAYLQSPGQTPWAVLIPLEAGPCTAELQVSWDQTPVRVAAACNAVKECDYKLPAATDERRDGHHAFERQSVQKQLCKSVRAPQTLGSL
jgi:hypothetical protein